MNNARIEAITNRLLDRRVPAYLGNETEGMACDTTTLEFIHKIGEKDPVQAIKQWLTKNAGDDAGLIVPEICPDVTTVTVEANPGPSHSPKASAADIRLASIMLDAACQGLSNEHNINLQLLNGAALRPPNVTRSDVSIDAPTEKQAYYGRQVERYGDAIAEAAGDHRNISPAWIEGLNPQILDRILFRLTAMKRLIATAPKMALGASPLHYASNGGNADAVFGTALTSFTSTRLGSIWPGRTAMDVSGMWASPESYRKTMHRFAQDGTLLFGRDVWLLNRAQPGKIAGGKSFQEACIELGLDLKKPNDIERAKSLILTSFDHGPQGIGNPLQEDPEWKSIEAWRQDLLKRIINVERSHEEDRSGECPPAFNEYTPYEFNKMMDTFNELLSILLTEEPDFTRDLSYDENTLQLAKQNEINVLKGDLDTQITWIPTRKSASVRQVLKKLVDEITPLAQALGRNEDLELMRRIIEGDVLPPAALIRKEVAEHYGMNLLRQTYRTLPDDSYPQKMMARTRTLMEHELTQITSDITSMHTADQPHIRRRVELARRLRVAAGISSKVAA